MMNYANYMGQNPYNMMQPHPSYFANALQQPYFNQQQTQNQQNQGQQQITTQPPIMQPQANEGSKMNFVTNKEEATVRAVDLINGTPSFFYNKSNGEIYLKQFDIPTGKGIFKTYVETQPIVEEMNENSTINNLEKEINYLVQGMDNLHRMIAQIQEQRQYPVNIKEVNTDSIDIEPEKIEPKNKKRGQ